jgi:DNA-binding beta-propeller fold protein YncE
LADSGNNTIRKVLIATGAVVTLAGSAGTSGSSDGSGVSTMFDHPQGITTDGTNLYVADTNNHVIRKVAIATGAVTTLAGNASDIMGSADGTGADARFYYTYGITTDGTNLYVADSGNGKGAIRKVVIATGAVSTLAGGESDGNGTSAKFYHPQGITTDGTKLYVTNSANNTINIIK